MRPRVVLNFTKFPVFPCDSYFLPLRIFGHPRNFDIICMRVMDRNDEMYALRNYGSQKRGNVSEFTVVEGDDRDRVNLARVGKKQVLKVFDYPACAAE